MFSAVNKMMLAISKTQAPSKPLATGQIARDIDTDASPVASSTRQRTRTRTTSLKGLATCRPQTCTVTVISTSHALTATAFIQRTDPTVVPVFVATHTTTEEYVMVSPPKEELETTQTKNVHNPDASERVYEADEHLNTRSCEGVGATQGQAWCCTNDAHAKVVQKCQQRQNSALMTTETIELLDALYRERHTVVWEAEISVVPHIALTSADESWDDFVARYSNQLNPQCFGDYLNVPLTIPVSSPFGSTHPPSKFDAPVTVFSPSRFVASVHLSLTTHAPYQALFAQKHTYKAVAYVACLAGASLRAYYENPTILQQLDKLYVFAWSDPAAPLLQLWRNCAMVTIHQSEHPFRGVPHIVVSCALPSSPWDAEVPEQDECFLTLPMWEYMKIGQEEDEEETEEAELEEGHIDDDEGYAAEQEQAWSESEAESEEARTPSPPLRPTIPFRRRSSGLADVFEEEAEEDMSDVPSVTETRFRHAWLLADDDDDDSVSGYPAPSAFTPPSSMAPRFSARFSFHASLPGIGEASREDAYRPLSEDYKPLWTRQARLPASPPVQSDPEAARTHSDSDGARDVDSESLYTDARERLDDSETDQSQYVDAAETDVEPSEDEYRYRAHDVLRPSCNIFVNDGDESDVAPFPRIKPITIPAPTFDWSDSLDSDSLPSPSFEDAP